MEIQRVSFGFGYGLGIQDDAALIRIVCLVVHAMLLHPTVEYASVVKRVIGSETLTNVAAFAGKAYRRRKSE